MSESTEKPTTPPAEVIDAETGEIVTPAEETLELAQVERRGISLSSVQDIDTMAVRLAKSDLVPRAFRGKPADVFLALNLGLELGLSPIASLRSLHVIEGKPSLSADAMVAVVIASGACDYFVCRESSPSSAIYETRRKGTPVASRASFSIDEAKAAELLGKDNWKKHPKSMLKARAKSMLARDVYPDVLHGIYTPDELEHVINTKTVLDELQELLLEAKTKPELDAIGQRAFAELTSKEQDKFRPIFKRHSENLAKMSKNGGAGA